VGYQIWCASRAAHVATSRRDKRAKYKLKNRLIEFAVQTLAPAKVWLNYQVIAGEVSVLITIFGASRKWVFHTYLERLSAEIRSQVREMLGDPKAFLNSQCA
jgi:hypothetical protein